MSNCYVIMGSARSGTSLTAAILHKLGVCMGWELQPDTPGVRRFDWPDPTPMNPYGFFADAPLENCQDKLWGDRYPKEGVRPLQGSPHVSEFKKLIKMRSDRGFDWGFKASRTPWMMPELIESCHDKIHLVITKRDHEVSAQSLHTWFPQYKIDMCREWVRRVRTQIGWVLESYSQMPRMEIEFNAYFDNPLATVKKLAEFCGKNCNDEAVAFVDGSLRRAG